MNESEKFIQHRGLREGKGLPNSFESILKNYRGSVEADAVLLKDGNIAVLHERNFNMSLSDIESLDLKELEQLRIPSSDPETGGRMIPLLREYMGLASDSDTRTALEIKASSAKRAVELVEKILDQFLKMKEEGGFKPNEKFLESNVSLNSFSTEALEEAQKIMKEKKISMSTGFFWPSSEEWAKKVPLFSPALLEEVEGKENFSWSELGIEIAYKKNFTSIEFQPGEITKELVDRAHAKKIKVGTSVVYDEKTADKLVKMGVDYVTTEQ